MANDKKELCTIRILFSADSDTEAIEIKQKIRAVLADKPDAQVHFALMPVGGKLPNGVGLR